MKGKIFRRLVFLFFPTWVFLLPFCSTTPPESVPTSPYEERTAEEELLFQAADAYLREGKLDKARDSLKELLERNPNNIPAHLRYQDLELALDRRDAVLNEYVTLLDERGDAFALLLYGRLLEDDKERVRYYQKAMKLDPAFHWIPYALGQHYLIKGDRAMAKKWFKKSLALFPCFPDALLAMGRLTYKKEDWEKSEEYYKRYLQCNKEDGTAHYELGLLWVKRKEYSKAKEEFEKALSINPDDPWILVNLGNVLREEGAPEEAMRCYEQAIAKAPRDPELYLNLGILCEEEEEVKDIPRAIKMYKKYLELGGADKVKVGMWIEKLEEKGE